MKILYKTLILKMSKGLLHGIIIAIIFSSYLIAGNTNAQAPSIRHVKISLDLESTSLPEVFAAIEAKTTFIFSYEKTLMANRLDAITIKVKNQSVAAVLEQVAKATGLSFKQIKANIMVKVPPSTNRRTRQKPPIADRIIKGNVTDPDGTPLPGANVIAKGTTIGTNTDVDGNYVLSAPDDATVLLFSYIGYVTEEVEIASRSVIDMVLLPDITSLEEITVSTGYWEVDKKLNPGNIAKVEAKTIEQQPVVNPLEAIQGRVPGVFIQQSSGVPGAAVTINIRGLNSLNNGVDGRPNANLPFYVIDGVPFMANSLNSGDLNLSGGNPLASLRPQDIESIEVLKDADATAIYGSRGANGVILITTKKGNAGTTTVDINFSQGIGEVANRVDVLNTEQYLTMRREAIQNDDRGLSGVDSTNLADLFLWGENRNTDWQEELVGETASQTNAGIAISGGNARTQFLFRGSFFRQTNVYRFDDSAFESISGLLNVNHRSRDDRLTINLSTNYTVNINNQNGGRDLISRAVRLAPNAPSLFDEEGDLNWADNFVNPLGAMEQEYENKTNTLVSNLNLNYEIISGLSIGSAFGYTNTSTNEFSLRPLRALPPENRETGTGTLIISEGENETWIIEPQLKYYKEIDIGTISIQVGGTLQGSSQTGLTTFGVGYDSDLLIQDITQAPTIVPRNNVFLEYRYSAIYSRLNYNYKQKYLLNLTGRRDGSSRFGPEKQFGNFGAVGAAWIFTNESFLKSAQPSFLSFGKFRASYGITGNDQIADYGFLDTYGAPENGATYNGNSGLIVARAANPDYSWEENRKLEIGLELGLLKNHVNLVASWFRNRSDNQLIGRPLSAVTGFSTIQFNLPALVENRGLEIELSTTNINKNDFTWTSAINFTRVRNELAEFPNIENFDAFNNRYEVGRSLFGSKQYKSLGVDPETGIYELADLNGDDRITNQDQQDFVEVVQDFYGGLNNTLQWKNFQLDVFFRFVKQNGRDFMGSFGAPGTDGIELFNGNQTVEVLDRWQSFGDTTPIQKFTRSNNEAFIADSRHSLSRARLVDASFIRLQNVALSWVLPDALIRKAKLSRARVYMQGQNLLTFTPYDGLDPETQGLNLPPLRMITTGIQLTF